MRRLAVAILVCLGALGAASAGALAAASGQWHGSRFVTVGNDDGELARVPLDGDTFAVSYRNSIYQTLAEERYAVQPDGTFRLVQIAADQLAVLEEYYGVPDAPSPVGSADRRNYVVPPHPERPAVFESLSIAATDLGQRTLHVPGEVPLELWRLVGDSNPFVVLDTKENP